MKKHDERISHSDAKKLLDSGHRFTNAALYEPDHAEKGARFARIMTPNGKDVLRFVRVHPPQCACARCVQDGVAPKPIKEMKTYRQLVAESAGMDALKKAMSDPVRDEHQRLDHNIQASIHTQKAGVHSLKAYKAKDNNENKYQYHTRASHLHAVAASLHKTAAKHMDTGHKDQVTSALAAHGATDVANRFS